MLPKQGNGYAIIGMREHRWAAATSKSKVSRVEGTDINKSVRVCLLNSVDESDVTQYRPLLKIDYFR
ncbi:hypothetical protein COP1_009518 [Malus domestica]